MRPLAAAVLVCVMCMSVVSFSPQMEGRPEGASFLASEESVLRLGYLQEVDNLNPFMGLTDASRVFYSLVYDCLFSVGDDMEVLGNLVTEWGPVPLTDPEMVESGDPYGSVWEYTLTENAAWHDGTPFTAEDVAWLVNMCANFNQDLWAYQPYTFFIDDAEVVDTDTVRIHYFDRTSGEPSPVAFGDSIFIPLVPRHKLSGMTPSQIGFDWNGTFWDGGPRIVGTGPFMVTDDIWTEFVEGDQLTLVRNPDYHWAADKGLEVQFDKIVMYFYDDPTTLEMALRQGLLDAAQLPPENYIDIKEDVERGDLEDVRCFDGLRVNQYWTEILINMNDQGPNCARLDPAVRLAMAMATDKDFIVDEFYAGLAEPGSTLISPFSEAWHYDLPPDETYGFNIEAAGLLLEIFGYEYTEATPGVRVATADSYAVEMGYVEEGTPLEFDMLVRREHPEERDIAAYLQAVWADVGIWLNYRVVDEVVMATEVYSYEYDTAIWYWSMDPDPNYILFCQSMYAWGGWSDNLYFNPVYDESYNASVRAMDKDERKLYVDSCQLTHYWDASYIILAYPGQNYAFRTDTFVGWGDWGEDPGRSLDAYWGANPILFDLVPPDKVTNVAPSMVGIALPDGPCFTDCRVELVFSAYDPDMDDLLFEMDLGDGELVEVCSESATGNHSVKLNHTYTSAGNYSVSVTVDDRTGIDGHVVGFGPVVLAVIDDDFPPVTTAVLDGDEGLSGWYLSSVTVALSASDVGIGVNRTIWSLDDGVWTDYVEEIELSAQGVTNLSFKSLDVFDNIEDAQTIAVKIDTGAPTVAVDMASAYTKNDVVAEISWSDSVSGVSRVTVSLDGGSEVDNHMSDTVSLSGLSDGEHTLTVWAYDVAGHSSSVMVTFTVETSLFALDGPVGPWGVVGVVAAVLAIAGLAGYMLYRRRLPPAP